MFNWFWEFLYGLAKSLFQLADAMVYGSKKLCGIESIEVNGEETDLLSYLFRSNEVSNTFKIVALSGILVVMFFAVFAILRSITNRKQETSPAHVLVQTGKTLLIFLFVPAVMLAFMWICNEFILVINNSLTGSGEATLGSFLFTTCAEGAWIGEPTDVFIDGTCSYANMGDVCNYVDLKSFNYMLAFLAGIAILFPIASMLIMFVDRAISIVLLFIVSPYSISSNVLDDGAHFKLWRDQVLVKFVTGYGCIIALNIYAIVIKLVVGNGVVFFPTGGAPFLPIVSNSFLNSLMKVAIVVGGAFSLKKIMAVIGNLVASGAGSNELRDSALANSELGRYFLGTGKFVGGAISKGIGLGGKLVTGRGFQGMNFRMGNLANTNSANSSNESVKNDNQNRFSAMPTYHPAEAPTGRSTTENVIFNGGRNSERLSAAPVSQNQNDKPNAVTNAILQGSASPVVEKTNTNEESIYDEDLK